MLAPITELHYTESALLRLNLASMARYPDYVAELEDETGRSAGYLECGTIEMAWDAADLQALRDLHVFGNELGLSSELLTGSELRALEPALAPGLPGGLLAEFDHQVDPRALHDAQFRAAMQRGVGMIHRRATLDVRAGRVHGVHLDDGSRLSSGTVVLAAGAWSGLLADVPVRPVKGQTVRLRVAGERPLRRVLRATVKGNPIYVVPRADDRIVIGASSEEAGFDMRPRAGAVYELLRDAQSVVPELSEAVLDELCTGLRPGSADNGPLIGAAGISGLLCATGHYRNGILLTPITANAVAQITADATVPDAVLPFSPERVYAA
jgi:glycine oxidase